MDKEASKKIDRIVIFTLESFNSIGAINKIVEEFRDKIVLICVSKRFGGKYGSFWHQLKKNLSRSGLGFVQYLSFHLIYYKPFIHTFDIINKILGRPKKIYTISQLSKKYKIPVLRTYDINSFESVSTVKKARPDLIISAYFDQVIRQDIINTSNFVINIHTALLPNNRGPFPVIWSFLGSNQELGVTIHLVNNDSLDTGPVIRKMSYRPESGESVLYLDYKLMSLGSDLISQLIKESENNKFFSQQQSEGTYYSFPTKNDLKKLKIKKIKLYKIKDYIEVFT